MALPDRSAISVEEYLRLDRDSIETRYEYIDGHVRMLAGGTVNHSQISVNIARILYDLLRGSPCRVLNSDMRVRLSESRYVYPDVTVSCDGRDRGTVDIIQSPRLVVEVLSSSTEDYDRGRKFTYYRTCPTIQEYMLISSTYQSVEVFRRERKNLWTLQVFGPDDMVALTGLGVTFAVSAVYEGVALPGGDNQPA
ncbi:MAG TPA: Uma2 family endonuclease [Ktedonosporobacter sp.]|jgi:Uma2 family endonuclease|nr:Uma2 family endonuclease [Ktedonosporobacter sp.]